MKYQHRKIGMTLVEVIIILVVFLFISISIFPAFLMATKLNMVSLAANVTDISAQQQIESLYSYSATGTLADALITLQKSYEIVTDGNTITLTKSDTITSTIIILEKDKPAGGMTSTKITVSLVDNERQLIPSHIETILVFQ